MAKSMKFILAGFILSGFLFISCNPATESREEKKDQIVDDVDDMDSNSQTNNLEIKKLDLPMENGKHTLPSLDYAYDALEPNIDAQTMEIHHTKHHQAYINKLNDAIEGTDKANMDLEDILKNISQHPVGVRNNGGGHWNHTFFWKVMSPDGGGKPSGKLLSAIESKFESFEKFQQEFNNAGATRFGSGWAWLVVDANGELQVTSTPNQDNPLMDVADVKGNPILGVDVWEHAYYLKYQNRRPDYLNSFWNVINWNEVERLYDELVK